MSKKLFTKKEIEILSKNPYVLNVTEKGITYTDEYKNIYVNEYNNGLSPHAIFEKYNFNILILGTDRILSAGKRWRKQANREEGLCDTRKLNTGRPIERTLSDEETIERLKHKIAILEQENSYLKKIRLIEKDALRKAQRDKNTV